MISLIGLHILSGCVTVPMMFGIGKSKALKAVKDAPLSLLGEIDADFDHILQEASIFVSKYYGQVVLGHQRKERPSGKEKLTVPRNQHIHQHKKSPSYR